MSTTTQAPISVQNHPVLGPSVSCRDVYSVIAVSRASRDVFSDWFRDKQRKLGLVEGKDFVTTSINIAGNSRKHIEHIITIDAARRIAELATANRGLELAAYLKYYTVTPEPTEVAEITPLEPTPGAPISLFQQEVAPVDGSNATFRPLEPQPAAPVANPLSPVQQLLAHVQKLADQEASRANESDVQPERFKALEGRLNQLERSVNTMLYFFQQSSTALRSLAPAQLPFDAGLVSAPLPDLEPTKRVKINRLVDGYAAAKTVTHQEVWKHLYGHLSSRFSFDAWQFAQTKKNPNYLEIVEENGQLDNLYSLAVELLTLSQR